MSRALCGSASRTSTLDRPLTCRNRSHPVAALHRRIGTNHSVLVTNLVTPMGSALMGLERFGVSPHLAAAASLVDAILDLKVPHLAQPIHQALGLLRRSRISTVEGAGDNLG